MKWKKDFLQKTVNHNFGVWKPFPPKIPKEESDGWLDDKKDSAEDNYAFDKRELDGVDERMEKKRLRKEAKKKDKKDRKEKRR